MQTIEAKDAVKIFTKVLMPKLTDVSQDYKDGITKACDEIASSSCDIKKFVADKLDSHNPSDNVDYNKGYRFVYQAFANSLE